MPRGRHQHIYFSNPSMDKPLEAIYEDMDSFTDEVFAKDAERQQVMSTFMPLLPVRYRDKFLKGILFTHGADLLIERNPRIQELFHVCAFSMWSSIPTSVKAEVLFTLYPNAQREAWFKQKNPDRAQQIWVPLEDADFFDHYRYAPQEVARDIDILCVSRLDDIKNLPMLGAALRLLQQPSGGTRYRCVLVTGRKMDMNWSQLSPGERNVMRKLQHSIGECADYLYVEPQPQGNLSTYYSRAKCLVLCSLVEGKNRTIHEAASCDTPIVTFAQFNQYLRGTHRHLPPEVCATAPEFTPQSLAQTIEQVLATRQQFRPRDGILSMSGKHHTLNTLVDALPYYREKLPDYRPGAHLYNRWLDLAMVATHKLSLHQHLHSPPPSMLWTKGLPATEQALRILEQRLGVGAQA